MYEILESDNYKMLTHLFYESGLEVTPGIEKPDDVIKCWECNDSDQSTAGRRCIFGKTKG